MKKVACFLCLLCCLLGAELKAAEPVCLEEGQLENPLVQPELLVVTLNMAHGRKDGRNQMLLKGETIRANLLDVAALMNRSSADVIALQEADAESRWSGQFNHVELLAQKSRFNCFIHGIHASKRLYDFGTALMSATAWVLPLDLVSVSGWVFQSALMWARPCSFGDQAWRRLLIDRIA